MKNVEDYYSLDPSLTDPRRLKKEREEARKLKKTHWWRIQMEKGICYYCQNKFSPEKLTLDHLVPLARGGRSTKNNVVPACFQCNQSKKLHTPVDWLLQSQNSEGDS